MKKFTKISFILTALFSNMGMLINAQTTLHLRSNASDYLDNYTPTLNQGTSKEIDAIAWTAGGTPFVSRSVLNFDLSAIPAHSTILSAYLSLWGDTNTGNAEGDSYLSGSNAWLIQRVTSSWNANTVNWNTQPTTTVTNEVSMPQSTSIYEIFNNINVTALMQDIINNSPNNYGLLFRLQTESYYRSMVFCSSQYPDTNEIPLLVITYQSSEDTCVNLRFTQSDYLDSYVPTANYGTSKELDAIAWTSGGAFTSRSVLDFNWDTIPAGATITSATLSLYGDSNTSNYEGDSSLSGPNNWLIQRVTSTWNGSTVNWSTQPTTDTTDQVHMPTTFPIYKDFPSIDVTKLVQDIVNNSPNQFGILWRLATEVKYRSVVFSSNYYPNPARRPTLSVCYTSKTGVQQISDKPVISVYPNPTKDNVTITYSTKNGENVYYTVYDLTGKQLITNTLLGKGTNILGTINTAGLSSGMYLIKLTDGNNITNYKFIKQ
ncbi:MAG TPA: DNRLRE domain-containing protein [Bacteroidia bacterium]|jgi:hypothetical protein|nr:DNRLRE domain-containing protein [Bacteroidia bacterium]